MVINSMGQHGKPVGMARKGTIEMEAQRAGQARASAKTMSRPTKGGSVSPRTHTLYNVREKHEHVVE